jgi:hypothetical protein
MKPGHNLPISYMPIVGYGCKGKFSESGNLIHGIKVSGTDG